MFNRGGGTSWVKCSSSSGGVRPRPQMGQPYKPASRAPERLIISDVDFDGQFCDENHPDEDVDPSSPRNRI